MIRNEAEPSLAEELPETGSLATPISSASKNNISEDVANVKDTGAVELGFQDAVYAIDEALGVKRSVDANTGSNYNDTINNGGTEYDRGTGTGDSAEGMAGVQRRDGYEAEGQREHGGVAQHSGVLRLILQVCIFSISNY